MFGQPDSQLRSSTVTRNYSSSAFWREELQPCPVCGSSDAAFLGTRGGRSHRTGQGVEARIVRCSSCHLVYSRPAVLPLGNPYADLEPHDYFESHPPPEKRTQGLRLIRTAEEILGRKGRLLELGCGRGDLLFAAREQGWQVEGVEMTPAFADAAAASGIPIERSSVENARALDRESAFDLIYLAAVLEHLYDPVSCLKRARRALAPGGILFIDVPNECSLRTTTGNLYMRLRGRHWAVNLSPTFPPFHVVGFCPRSLRRALAESGLEEHTLEVVRWPVALPRTTGFSGLIESAGARLVDIIARMARDGDGIVCWARRPTS